MSNVFAKYSASIEVLESVREGEQGSRFSIVVGNTIVEWRLQEKPIRRVLAEGPELVLTSATCELVKTACFAGHLFSQALQASASVAATRFQMEELAEQWKILLGEVDRILSATAESVPIRSRALISLPATPLEGCMDTFVQIMRDAHSLNDRSIGLYSTHRSTTTDKAIETVIQTLSPLSGTLEMLASTQEELRRETYKGAIELVFNMSNLIERLGKTVQAAACASIPETISLSKEWLRIVIRMNLLKTSLLGATAASHLPVKKLYLSTPRPAQTEPSTTSTTEPPMTSSQTPNTTTEAVKLATKTEVSATLTEAGALDTITTDAARLLATATEVSITMTPKTVANAAAAIAKKGQRRAKHRRPNKIITTAEKRSEDTPATTSTTTTTDPVVVEIQTIDPNEFDSSEWVLVSERQWRAAAEQAPKVSTGRRLKNAMVGQGRTTALTSAPKSDTTTTEGTKTASSTSDTTTTTTVSTTMSTSIAQTTRSTTMTASMTPTSTIPTTTLVTTDVIASTPAATTEFLMTTMNRPIVTPSASGTEQEQLEPIGMPYMIIRPYVDPMIRELCSQNHGTVHAIAETASLCEAIMRSSPRGTESYYRAQRVLSILSQASRAMNRAASESDYFVQYIDQFPDMVVPMDPSLVYDDNQ